MPKILKELKIMAIKVGPAKPTFVAMVGMK